MVYNLVCFKTKQVQLMDIVIINSRYGSFFIDYEHESEMEYNPNYPNCKFWTL